MRSLKHFSWVVLLTTLGNFCNMQIKVAITKKQTFFNISGSMHDSVSQKMSRPMFSWSKIYLKAFKQVKNPFARVSHMQIRVAITEKPIFFNISGSMQNNTSKRLLDLCFVVKDSSENIKNNETNLTQG